MKEKQPFRLPDSTLSQLNEQTLGFLLCYVDDQGNVVITQNCGNEVTFLSIISKLGTFINSINESSIDMMREDISHQDFEEE